MSGQLDFVARLTEALKSAGIPHMVVGSNASSLWGAPRATHDLDLVIDPTEEQLDGLVASLGPGWYADASAARAALRQRSMFNVIDTATGWKADLIIRKDRPFSREEFARRKLRNLLGRELPVASAEDVMLTKLEWARRSGSERQLSDVREIVAMQGHRLDLDYLRRWARELRLAEDLEGVLEILRDDGVA